MLNLLTPTALLALAGLLVPVAIHLWNRRPGREVAVGSLRWLAAGANRRLRNLRLEQVWLLLLRGALLAVLAVAVAEPVWKQAHPASRGVVLLGPEVLGTPAFAALRPTIDSLRRRGYGVRWLAAGFARIPGATWRADSGGRRGKPMAFTIDTKPAELYWARVRQAADVFPDQPLFVVTAATARNLQGSHPPLPPAVTWQTLPLTAAATWLQAAALRADSLRLLLGYSTENQTYFRLQALSRPSPGAVLRVAGLPPLRLEVTPAGSRLAAVLPAADSAASSADGAGVPVPVRTRPLRVVVYATPSYALDARYLQAGLRAAAMGLPMPLEMTTTSHFPSSVAPPDWLFWLSDTPLPAVWREAARQGVSIWQEASGTGRAETAQLATTATGAASTTIFRRSAASQPEAEADSEPDNVVWADGLGRAVLSRQAVGLGARYQLHTRLHPAWSELADDPALPERLLRLLQPAPDDEPHRPPTALARQLAAHDQRALDPAQLSADPGPTAGRPVGNAGQPVAFRTTALRPWLVLAAGLLLLLERVLARRREATAISLPAL